MTTTVDLGVVVAVRDGARYLAAALDSVLAQEPAPREVVVVDDGSTDETPAVLQAYADRVTALRQDATGAGAALNRGITAVTSQWVGFVDADDEWTPAAVASRWAHTGDPATGVVAGRVQQFVSPELPAATRARFTFDATPMRANVLGSMLVRRSVFAEVGPIDETLRSAWNIDWIARTRSAAVRTVEVDDVVLRRRLHEGNLGVTLDKDVTMQALRAVVRAHHQRGRSGS